MNNLFTWCSYEVPEMILLHYLKGAMRVDRNKDMSLHVSTCTSYDFSALTQLYESCGADKMCVSVP
jgi:hypothetical protein